MEPYIGEIRMFAGDFAPRGWALCDGSLLRIDQWDKLFSIIQTYYGGDGASNFAVPDLRGRAPVSAGASTGYTSGYYLGQRNGSENVTLTPAQMPAHSHVVNAFSGGGDLIQPSAGVPASTIDPGPGTLYSSYSSADPNQQMSPKMIQPSGDSRPFSVIQPVLAVTYIIALEGIYPPRP